MFGERTRRRTGLLIWFTLVLMTSACGSGEPQVVEVTRIMPQTVVATQIVPQTVEVTQVVPQTVVVTEMVQVVVTATPEPPTPTPEPTPMPVFQKWTSQQVVDAFKAAGLEAENARPMTKDDYGFAPMTAIEGTRFLILSLCEDCGGRIFSFTSQSNLEVMQTYYSELGKSSAIFFSWVFVKDNILVQINGDLPEDRASRYEATLHAMK